VIIVLNLNSTIESTMNHECAGFRLKAQTLLIILTCFLLYACKYNEDAEKQNIKKVNLSKAAAYNVQLGLGYLKQGDRPRAKKKLLTALKQEPDSADAYSALAYYFEQTSELEQAKQYYLKALSLSGNKGAQLNNYGAFLCRQRDYKKAESYFLKAAQDLQYIHTSGAYENAGLCALSIPDNDKARLYFTKALNQDPTRKVSFYELVKLESKTGHAADAFALVTKHADLVIKDRILLSLAKDVAHKVGKKYTKIALKQYIDNSGVQDEYNNHAG